MFILSAIEEEIRVSPQELSKTPLDAVTEVIEQRFLDTVIPNLGLIVSIYDVQNIEGGFIYPNDGAAFFRVQFRVVVFRPYVGEVIVGRLKSCSREGLKVSVDFFDDIIIPEYALQEPSFYNESEKLWVWKFDENDMFMDLGEEVRLKVRSVRFNAPPTPAQMAAATAAAAATGEPVLGTAAKPFAPMEVIGDVNGDGLGLVSWWGGGDGEEAGDAMEG